MFFRYKLTLLNKLKSRTASILIFNYFSLRLNKFLFFSKISFVLRTLISALIELACRSHYLDNGACTEYNKLFTIIANLFPVCN